MVQRAEGHIRLPRQGYDHTVDAELAHRLRFGRPGRTLKGRPDTHLTKEANVLTIYDDVHDYIQVPDGLLTDLLASNAVQRLRKVSQAGASSLVRPGRTVTRYEHSLGVMIITGKLGGSDTEQAAGLLQDVSHTAFSHTIDYVFEDRQEEFHEKIFKDVVEASDIPGILDSYGLTWQELFSATNLKRVDVSAPLLCADRLDYTLRDLRRFGHISREDAAKIVSALTFTDDIIAFTDIDSALHFTEMYRYLVSELFMNPLELYAHAEMARIIREAMRAGVLEEADLLGTDDVIIGKLSADTRYGSAESLSSLKKTHSVVTDYSRKGHHVYSKGRMIDPPVLSGGEITKLSEIRPETLSTWDRIKDVSVNGIFVRPGD
jgi:HD superfamily phosphohydrolase